MKKNNNVFVVVIIFLAVLLVLSIGFSVYYVLEGNKLNSNNNTEEKEQSEAEEVLISKKQIEELMKIVEAIPEADALTAESLNNITYSDKVKLAADLSGNEIEGLSEKEIKQILTDVFGSNLNITSMEDVICTCGEVLYRYDQSKGMYVYNEEHDWHEVCGVSVYEFFESYKQEGNRIVLNLKKIFNYYCDISVPLWSSYYITYDDAKNQKNMKHVPEELKKDDLSDEEVYEIVKDNLPIYTYVFEKVDNNYRFVKYTISNNI